MSTNHTRNYGLCQWELDDKVLHTDFNEDNAKIDAALGAQASRLTQTQSALSTLQSTAYTTSYQAIVVGSYAGNDAESRTITLGFRPRGVIVLPVDGNMGYNQGSESIMYSGAALDGVKGGVGTYLGWASCVEITSAGFRVFESSSGSKYFHLNQSNHDYFYFAFR